MTDCPIAFERLVDACAGELSQADEEALEDHVFACDACGEAYARVTRMIRAVRTFIPPVITHERLARLQGGGTRVTLTRVAVGASVAVAFRREVDLLVHALRGDLSGVRRIDVALEGADGTPLVAFEDVPFDREQGEVLIACQRHYAALGFPSVIRFRVQADTAEGPRAIGDYVVDHAFGW